MKNLNFSVRTMLILFTSGILISCGGGGASSGSPSVQSNEIPSIQGTWRSNSCVPDGDTLVTDEIAINATVVNKTIIAYVESEECAGALTVFLHLDGTLNFPGEYTGDAQHIDIIYNKARMTASEQFISALAARGTTLQDRAAAAGITDINNVPINIATETPQLYTIYSVERNTLNFGVSTPSFTGLEPALRHNMLDTNTYSRVISDNVVSAEFSDATNSGVIGVVFYEGEIKTTIDGIGNVIQVQVGEGTYLILEDLTAVLATSAPADFDLETYRLEEGGDITTLQALEFEESDILPPLMAGYKFDFRGKNANAGFAGPTFRSIVFSGDGSFERSRDSFISTAESTGTYSIAGNNIELRYNNGVVERTVFATDGSTIAIVGQQRYTAE